MVRTPRSPFELPAPSFAQAVAIVDAGLMVVSFAWLAIRAAPLPTVALPTVLAAMIVAAFLVRPKEALLAFGLYVLFYETIARWTVPSVKHVDEITVPLLFLITFIRRRPIANHLIRPVREGAIGFVAIIAVISSLVNQVPLDVLAVGLLLLVKGALVFYVVLWIDWTREDIAHAVRVVGLVGIVILALGCVEFLNPAAFQRALDLRPEQDVRGGLTSVKSIFFHPVLFGWFTGFVGLFLFAYYSVFRRWWQLALALIFTAGNILSGRRKSIAGVVGALVLGAISQLLSTRDVRRFARTWGPAAMGLLLVGLLFLPYLADLGTNAIDRYLPPGGSPAPVASPAPSGPVPSGPAASTPAASTPAASEGSATPGGGANPTPRAFSKETPPRVALYLVSVDVARDHFPLGAGLARYGSYLSVIHFSPLYAQYGLTSIPGLRPSNPSAITDTFWPQLLGELGVFGMLGFALFVLLILVELWRIGAKELEPSQRAFTFGAMLVLMEAIVESVAAPMFAAPSATYFVLGVAAVALSLDRRRRSPSRSER